MESYLEPVDDGLPMRESGQWALIKLDYLQRYIDAFITAMRNKPWQAIHYIDLFAGSGKCRVRDSSQIALGSPLIALTAAHAFTKYLFVDLDSANVEALEKRCQASSRHQSVHCFRGDGNHVVDLVVAELQKPEVDQKAGRWRSSLNLAFLDPEGLELQWSTVAKLASLSRMDLIIYYPQQALERNIDKLLDSQDETAIDRFFGSNQWRDAYRDWSSLPHSIGRHRLLMDHYRENLQRLGYVDIEEIEPLIRNTGRNAPLYRLLFASKHELGHKFWESVLQRRVDGQRRLPL